MSKLFYRIVKPELVFGIAGPIGIKIEDICKSIESALERVGYSSRLIKITDEVDDIKSSAKKPKETDFYSQMKYKMDHASEICRDLTDPSALMRYAIKAIQRERRNHDGQELPIIGINPVINPTKVVEKFKESEKNTHPIRIGAAYIIRQIKRPEEITLLNSVYGDQFILISAFGSEESRRQILQEKLRDSMSTSSSDHDIRTNVDDLIQRDMHEGDDIYGQHLRDSFHRADVFVDGIDKSKMDEGINRFIQAFFGATDKAPTKDEHGLFLATSASYRSSDLSRQVGAAVLTETGEVVAQGCNEVPKAGGGTYWDTETPDFRDVKLGYDANERRKNLVLRDLIERLRDNGLLSTKAKRLGTSIEELLTLLTSNERDDSGKGALKGSWLLDLTEYGRVVHAEMNAICDASRLGISTKDTTLYCTTFPCHNCTKHILASGIKRVVYLEPYPKSKAIELHQEEISLDNEQTSKVPFVPFMGIAPQKYKIVFSKGKRKRGAEALRWMTDDTPAPMIDVMTPVYVIFEDVAISGLDE